MIILVLFILIPFLAAAVVEYLTCRLSRRKWLRLIPPGAGGLILLLVGIGRYQVWSSDSPPWTQLIFVPGLPAVFLLLGFWAGWRLWRWRWTPRIISSKQKNRDRN